MREYIDRAKLIETIEDNYLTLNAIITAIYDAPAADVVPVVHAHWEAKKDPLGKKYHYCSWCKTEIMWRDHRGIFLRVDIENAPFCPNCGAKMDESEDGENV